MKLYIILTLTAVIMAFATGHSLLFLRDPHFSIPKDFMEIPKIKRAFQQSTPPITVIDFSRYYPTDEHLKLLLPQNKVSIRKVPQTGEDRTDYAGDAHCFDHLFKYLNIKNYQKLWVWEEFRCGLKEDLPEHYFSFPPFIHPSGESFVHLAFRSRFTQYRDVTWLRDHLPFFHIQELPSVKKVIGHFSGPFAVLETFDTLQLQDLLTGRPQVLSKTFFLVKIPYLFLPSLLKYKVYLRDDFDDFLRHTPYEVSPFTSRESCLLQDENICWNYNARHFFKMASDSSFYFFIGSLSIVFLVVVTLLNRIRSSRLEEERRRLALQVLTHEFRTPISSMLLQCERLNKIFELLPEEGQEIFLRLSDDTYRLQRLVEKSRSYLKMNQGKNLIAFNRTTIPSINDFFLSLFSRYEDQGATLHLLPDKENGTFELDTYWVGICFNNLLENALYHGEKPIEVFLHLHKSYIEVVVQDAGPCEFHSLEEMITPFVKGQKSKGTGLGLNLVYKISHEMGGYLQFKQHPKRFILGVR